MHARHPTILRRLAVGVAGALALVAALGLSACDTGSSDGTGSGGVVTGKVSLEGDVPDEKYIHVVGCEFWKETWGGPQKPRDEAVFANRDGTLPNVFVWAVEGPHTEKEWVGEARETQLISIDHHYFVPHVVGVMRDQEVRFINEDRGQILIDVPMGEGREPRHVELNENRSHTFQFSEALGPLKLVPEKHSWMHVWVHVLDHPVFASTDMDGRFRIEGLDPGTYRFRYWHETWGEGEFTATVEDGQTVRKNVTLSPKSD